MKLIQTPITDLVLIQPNIFGDTRGAFYESYNIDKFADLGIKEQFKQDNISLSQKDVLRGLHFQNHPSAQGKLVSVLKGSVLDVAVDIRKKSPTYGQYFAVELNDRERMMMYIPVGFAHGFLALEDNTIFSYKCTNTYNKNAEGSILWCDKDIQIQWGISTPLLSQKDEIAPLFNQIISPF